MPRADIRVAVGHNMGAAEMIGCQIASAAVGECWPAIFGDKRSTSIIHEGGCDCCRSLPGDSEARVCPSGDDGLTGVEIGLLGPASVQLPEARWIAGLRSSKSSEQIAYGVIFGATSLKYS